MPCMLTVILIVLGFTLSPQSCEKVGLQISVSLAIIIFLTIVNDMTPPTSEAVPLLGDVIKLVVIIIINLWSNQQNCLSLFLHRKRNTACNLIIFREFLYFKIVFAKFTFTEKHSLNYQNFLSFIANSTSSGVFFHTCVYISVAATAFTVYVQAIHFRDPENSQRMGFWVIDR